MATDTKGPGQLRRTYGIAPRVGDVAGVGYFKFDQGRRPRGASGRLAMAAAGDDPVAIAEVMQLIDRLGFDPVDAGSLTAGLALQPDGPVFSLSHTHDGLSSLLRSKSRT